MIIMLMFLGISLLGLILCKVCSEYDNFGLYASGVVCNVIGFVCLFLSLIVLIASHATASKTIQRNKLEYDGLCKRYEIVKSDYEDVSKSDVIADITEWNIRVYNTQYWTNNPWTNWFNPKAISDDLKYISLED